MSRRLLLLDLSHEVLIDEPSRRARSIWPWALITALFGTYAVLVGSENMKLAQQARATATELATTNADVKRLKGMVAEAMAHGGCKFSGQVTPAIAKTTTAFPPTYSCGLVDRAGLEPHWECADGSRR